MVNEEEVFSYSNLTGGVIFLPALIKCTKYIFNQKPIPSSDKNKHIHKSEMNNGWNTQVVQILHEDRYGKFHFKLNMLSILPSPVEL